jgi:iron uptake system component EfeO
LGLDVASKAVAAVLGVVVVACVGCAGAAPITRSRSASRSAGHTQVAAIERNLAASATGNYELLVRSAAGRLDVDTVALANAVAVGDAALSEKDELVAQSDFDAVAQVLDDNPAQAAAFDGLAAGEPSGAPFSGLHLVERDLWDGGNASQAVAAAEAEVPIIGLILSKVRLAPAAIVTVGVNTLGWVNDEVVTGDEEAYSHLDGVDAVAGVAAARAAFAVVAPLGRLAAPGATRAVVTQFTLLGQRVDALGPPGTLVDSQISQPVWRALAQQVDATAAALSRLGGDLAHFSAGGTYG